MHTSTLPDKALSATTVPNSDWDSVTGWTPSSYQSVGSVAGYTLSIACGSELAQDPDTDWTKYHYVNELQGKLEGNDVANQAAGDGSGNEL